MSEALPEAGRCLCGGVRYALRTPPEAVFLCHCRSCQQAQGAAFNLSAPVPREAFVLLAGEALLARYESSPGKDRVFCRRCGSPVYAERPDTPVRVLRAALLHNVRALPVQAQLHEAEALLAVPDVQFLEGPIVQGESHD